MDERGIFDSSKHRKPVNVKPAHNIRVRMFWCDSLSVKVRPPVNGTKYDNAAATQNAFLLNTLQCVIYFYVVLSYVTTKTNYNKDFKKELILRHKKDAIMKNLF